MCPLAFWAASAVLGTAKLQVDSWDRMWILTLGCSDAAQCDPLWMILPRWVAYAEQMAGSLTQGLYVPREKDNCLLFTSDSARGYLGPADLTHTACGIGHTLDLL